MGLIVAAIVLLAVAAAKSQRRASSGAQQPPQDQVQQKAPAAGSGEAAGSNPVQDFVSSATKLGGVEAAVAVAYTAAGYSAGKAITGTELGGALGAVNPIWGNAANAGSQGGKELDKLLGGREEAISNQAAQGAGAILAGGFVALGPLIGPLFLIGVGELLVLAYLIVVAVEDAGRLAYGQKGALADYEKEWLRMYGRAYDQVAKGVVREDGSVWKPTDAEINRTVWPFVDGYMRKRNELAFQRWMKQPWGLGKDAQGHAIYGRDRGYFVGEVAAGSLSIGPPRKSDSHEYAQFIPASEVVLVNVPRYDFYEEGIKDENPNTPWYLRAFIKESAPTVHSMYLHAWYNTNDYNGPTFDETQAKKDGYVGTRWVRKQNGTEQRYSDNRRWEIDRAGSVAGNVAEYVAWMKHPRGFGHTDASHLIYGRNEGRFDGEGAGGGLLSYEGQTWNWKDFSA